MSYRIGIIGGDGIGPEVVAEAMKCVDAAGVDYEAVPFDLGGARYLRDGVVLEQEHLDAIRELDAVMLGAVGTPDVPPGVIERGLLLRLRFELDLFVNLRPFVSGPNRYNDGVDMFVIRENTEGTYAGEGGFLRKDTPHEIATQGSVNTRMGAERAIRYAFDLAEARERKHVTLVHKTNVLTFAGDLWQRAFDAVAAEHPDVDTAYHHVDAACIYFVQDPGRYDVIVTDNLFGDILTDLGGAISGGIGRAASANLNPARTGPSLFEPVHGSAPDIAGTGTADPRAAIISAAMMLEFLGEADAAARVHAAIDKSDDIEGSTAEIGDAIAGEGVAMPFEKTEKIWMDGELVPWDDAKVHVLTHSLHYGSGVFEGIRTYAAADGPAVFRLTDHIQRLFDSAKLIMMEIPYTRDAIVDACKLTVRESGLDSCYLRPIAYLGYGEIGLNPLPCEVNVSIAAWPWGSYLGEESLQAGVRMQVSSWRRMDPNINPVAAKGTGIYINSSLAKVEAVKAGYDEAIMLNTQGFVAECTGENVFIVKDGVVMTPPTSSGALAGITRDSVMTIARDLGYPVVEQQLLRHDLYLADEAFLTGTAAEVVPIRSVDDREIGNRGEITHALQETYFAAVRGEVERYKDWLEYV